MPICVLDDATVLPEDCNHRHDNGGDVTEDPTRDLLLVAGLALAIVCRLVYIRVRP